MIVLNYRQKLMRHGKKGKMSMFLDEAPQETIFIKEAIQLTTKVSFRHVLVIELLWKIHSLSYQLFTRVIMFFHWVFIVSFSICSQFVWYLQTSSQVTPGLKRYVLRRQYPINTLEELERKVSYMERVQGPRWWQLRVIFLFWCLIYCSLF